MKLLLDNVFDPGIKDYLLTQKGVENLSIINKDFISEVDITYNREITPRIILKHIELYQNEQIPILIGYNKNTNYKTKKLKYIVEDMCCEYCYKGFVTDLFINENIKSVKSNFDFNQPAFNIEFFIEYNENYTEEELKKYIKEKYSN